MTDAAVARGDAGAATSSASGSRWTTTAPATAACSPLSELPIDSIKLDGRFARARPSTTVPGIVASIVDLTHALGRVIVAEGVEDGVPLAGLREIGCDLVQGCYVAAPAAAAAVEALLAGAGTAGRAPAMPEQPRGDGEQGADRAPVRPLRRATPVIRCTAKRRTSSAAVVVGGQPAALDLHRVHHPLERWRRGCRRSRSSTGGWPRRPRGAPPARRRREGCAPGVPAVAAGPGGPVLGRPVTGPDGGHRGRHPGRGPGR